MNALDCTDIKALLSALIDDRLDEHTRHQVERHLAGCEDCRSLLSEAERLDELIAVSADLELRAVSELSRGFEDVVLAQTVRNGEGTQRTAAGLVMWTGWFAAAASLALAGVVWFADGMTGSRAAVEFADSRPAARESDNPAVEMIASSDNGDGARQPEVAMEIPAVRYAASSHQQSRVFTGAFASPADLRSNDGVSVMPVGYSPVLGQPRRIAFDAEILSHEGSHSAAVDAPDSRFATRSAPPISRDDADAIYSVSLLLNILAGAETGSFADVERIRRVIEADEMLEFLAEIRERVDAPDRPALLAAEAVLVRIANGPLDHEDVRMLRQTVAELDLSQEVGSITQRWDAAYSL